MLSSTVAIGRSTYYCRRARLRAGWELERRDAGTPVERAASLQVFGGIPESAVVTRIDRHCAVVAPPSKVWQLRAAANLDAVFSFHRAQRICWHAARVADGRENAAAGRAIAHCDVADLV